MSIVLRRTVRGGSPVWSGPVVSSLLERSTASPVSDARCYIIMISWLYRYDNTRPVADTSRHPFFTLFLGSFIISVFFIFFINLTAGLFFTWASADSRRTHLNVGAIHILTLRPNRFVCGGCLKKIGIVQNSPFAHISIGLFSDKRITIYGSPMVSSLNTYVIDLLHTCYFDIFSIIYDTI